MPRILLTLLILLPIFSPAYAQNLIGFEHLTTANGLSSNIVTDILQDQQGFLWIATENGLNRYDGYEFQVFHSDPARADSISSDKIMTLYQSDKGELWIGTDNGLNRFDYYRLSFERFHPGNAITSLIEDETGNLIIGSEAGVTQFNLTKTSPGHFFPIIRSIC